MKEILIQTHHLKKGDIVKSNNRTLTFIKMDGMYGQWTNEEGKVVLGVFPDLSNKGTHYEPTRRTKKVSA